MPIFPPCSEDSLFFEKRAYNKSFRLSSFATLTRTNVGALNGGAGRLLQIVLDGKLALVVGPLPPQAVLRNLMATRHSKRKTSMDLFSRARAFTFEPG